MREALIYAQTPAFVLLAGWMFVGIILSLAGIRLTVSYTHLDVYKRQVEIRSSWLAIDTITFIFRPQKG